MLLKVLVNKMQFHEYSCIFSVTRIGKGVKEKRARIPRIVINVSREEMTGNLSAKSYNIR